MHFVIFLSESMMKWISVFSLVENDGGKMMEGKRTSISRWSPLRLLCIVSCGVSNFFKPQSHSTELLRVKGCPVIQRVHHLFSINTLQLFCLSSTISPVFVVGTLKKCSH